MGPLNATIHVFIAERNGPAQKVWELITYAQKPLISTNANISSKEMSKIWSEPSSTSILCVFVCSEGYGESAHLHGVAFVFTAR